MIINKYIDKRRRYLIKCDECGTEWSTEARYYKRTSSNPLWDKDRCNLCWRRILNNRPEYKEKMSNIITERYLRNPELKAHMSKICKERKINSGNKNGMKKLENRKKVSKARKEKFKNDKDFREAHAQRTKDAWKNGRMEGVKVGRCKWYGYTDRFGNSWKVQGTWELAFVKWLDNNDYHFKVHRDFIPYELDGNKKNYYPDFWVDEWKCYVDVKAKYFYDLHPEKFIAIKNTSGIRLKILLKEDLEELGIQLT